MCHIGGASLSCCRVCVVSERNLWQKDAEIIIRRACCSAGYFAVGVRRRSAHALLPGTLFSPRFTALAKSDLRHAPKICAREFLYHRPGDGECDKSDDDSKIQPAVLWFCWESKSERGAIGLTNFPRAEKWPPEDIIPEWRLEMASKFIFLLPVKKLWFYRNLK